MSLFVLDTDTLSLLQRGHPIVSQRVAAHAASLDVAVSIITVQEQIDGWYAYIRKARQPKEIATGYGELTDCVRSLSSLPLLTFTESAVLRFLNLQAMKLNVGPMDLRIAAVVLENSATLVTRNLRDFRRVPGLTIEDWSV
ncbi:MAG TPA: type II toxin-antitoxin system VapC family toxin [Gemmataceae bacterium]|nr:type II toxin-antitoxin system VapC family toxin [Gemmataceae bacterium]